MEWKHIRHVPVEDDEGRLVGLISHRDLLRLFAQGLRGACAKVVTVKDIMIRDPITVTPETSTLEAMTIMRSRRIGCLPVVENGRLVGILTAYDFLELSAEIIERQLGEFTENQDKRKPEPETNEGASKGVNNVSSHTSAQT
jgi:CBS domain-containing protein